MKMMYRVGLRLAAFALAFGLLSDSAQAARFTITAVDLNGNLRNDVAITVTAVGLATVDGREATVDVGAGATQTILNGVYTFDFPATAQAVSLTFNGVGDVRTTRLERVRNNAPRTLELVLPNNDQAYDYAPPAVVCDPCYHKHAKRSGLFGHFCR
jgi:hypothetical protein